MFFLKLTGKDLFQVFLQVSGGLLAVFGILGYRYTTSTSAFIFTWFYLLCAFVSTFPVFTRTLMSWIHVLGQGPIPVGLIEMFSTW